MSASEKKKILIVLSSDLFTRNYLTTGAFDKLEESFDCFYIADETVKHRSNLEKKNNFSGYYRFEKDLEDRHYRILNVLMYRFRHKSSSFRFRIKRGFYYEWISYRNDRFWTRIRFLPVAIFKAIKREAFFLVYGSRLTYPLFKMKHIDNLPVSNSISDIIQKVAPSAIIFPSSAFDPAGIDIVKICKSRNIPSIFLIDNWDNLSSKSIMWEKPDYMGVWGQQSVEHGVMIQGMSKERISIIGTPRFDNYFKVRDHGLKSHFEFRYILFVGTALEFDESGVLSIIDEIIKNNRDHFQDIKVVYRPHPWRQGTDTIIGKDLSNIIIDPQLYDSYASHNTEVVVQPDVNYYPSLLKNAEFIVGGLTTMLMEALIFRKRVLALVHDDGMNITSPHNVLKYYVHFKGIMEIEAMNFCLNLDNLDRDFIETWNLRNSIDLQRTDIQRNYFLYHDGNPYNLRLAALVNKVMGESKN
jgi:hypothetical protein